MSGLIDKIMKDVWEYEEEGVPYSNTWGHYITDQVIITSKLQEILEKHINYITNYCDCNKTDGSHLSYCEDERQKRRDMLK